MATTQERCHELLMERVRTDRYPSHQLLDRIEASLWTADQVSEHVDMLLAKIERPGIRAGSS